MKLIIAGTRTFKIQALSIETYIQEYNLQPIQIVSGGAPGIDHAGAVYARNKNIDLKIMKADWLLYGNAAGPIRNRQMAKYADALLLIWDGESRGSKNMKSEMFKLGKPIYEVIV